MEPTVHFNCYLTHNNGNIKSVCTYKIIVTRNGQYPYHLYILKNILLDQWQKLANYSSMNDAIKTMVHELFSIDINKAIHHGQLVLNTQSILKKIISGKMSISIATADCERPHAADFDFILEELVENKNQLTVL